MTDVAILETPKGWPAILLPRKAPSTTDPGSFDGLRRAVRDLGPT
jgi:hypothetical protein